MGKLQYDVKEVTQAQVLGSTITNTASTEVAQAAAAVRGNKTYYKYQKKLQDRQVPLYERIMAFYATAGAAFLHGSDGVDHRWAAAPTAAGMGEQKDPQLGKLEKVWGRSSRSWWPLR